MTHIPDQTPSEVVIDTAEERAARIGDMLSEVDIDVDYTVEGHISRNVGFGIVQTAREERTDLIRPIAETGTETTTGESS